MHLSRRKLSRAANSRTGCRQREN